jgi:hypothetical protein
MEKTDITFVDGFDDWYTVPPAVKSAGLSHRFAVIQDTYRSDSVGMYFDEALWRRLIDFALHFSPGSYLTAIVGERAFDWISFISDWENSTASNREPPAYVQVFADGKFVLCMATEYWTRVGGPMPYHDSYTYSFFSAEDLSRRIMQHLREAIDADAWNLASQAIRAERRPVWKRWLRTLWSKLSL